MRIRVAVVAMVVFGVVLSGTVSASAMTVEQAGPYYRGQVCALGPPIARLNWAMFRGKHTVRAGQLHGKRLRQIRQALLTLARYEARSGQRLVTPPSPWPTAPIAQATTAMGRALVYDSRILLQLRRKAGQGFARYWNQKYLPQSRLLVRLDRTATQRLWPGGAFPGC